MVEMKCFFPPYFISSFNILVVCSGHFSFLHVVSKLHCPNVKTENSTVLNSISIKLIFSSLKTIKCKDMYVNKNHN